MKFKIKYNYTTGDSYNSYTHDDLIELDFYDIKVAEKNLERIKEHYDQYEEIHSYRYRKNRHNQDILSSNKDKDWFVLKTKLAVYKDNINNYTVIDDKSKNKFIEAGYNLTTIIDDMSINSLVLYTDDGKPFQLHAPWCGYFESLNSIEIIIETKKYTF